MSFLSALLHQARGFPEYWFALKSALAVLAVGAPLYAGLRYFLHRRRLIAPWSLTLNFVSVFALFAGLAFLLASPLARHLDGAVTTGYLFLTCVVAALSVVSLVDVFLIQHYLSGVKKMYVSPPLRAVLKLGVFCVSILPILRFVLHFNPLALVAIPTIATAGLALALQDTLKTFIAGVGLGRIIRLGEWISFQDKEGRVVDINWARTVLQTREGRHVYIPNSQLQTGMFVNFTAVHPANRLLLKVGASYGAPPVRVKDVLLSCVKEVEGVAEHPAPMAALLEYGDSSIVYGVYYWLEDYSRRPQVEDAVATRVWYAFKREGIQIPFPTRTVQWQKTANGSETGAPKMAEALQRWRLAEAFYAEELLELVRWTRTRYYAPGEVIVREGDSGQSLFVVSEGTVAVLSAAQRGELVATLGPGEIFGEMSFLTGALRSATVRSQTAVEALEIEKAGLQAVLAKRPELSDRLAELVVARQAALAAHAASPSPSEPGNGRESPVSLARRIRQFFGL